MSKVIEDFSLDLKIDCIIIKYNNCNYLINMKTPNGEILCTQYFETAKEAKEWAINLLREYD